MPTTIDGEKYYTLQEFAKKSDKSYSYIRKCARGLQRSKDISEYTVHIENKPFISELALDEF
jgi:hypothetical protein